MSNTPSKPEEGSASIGRVLRIDAKACEVEVEGRRLRVPMRGRLFEERTHAKSPVAVGDRVELTLDAEGGAIDAVLPRESQLARRAKGDEDREQVIAANVTLVMVVAAVREPPLQPALIDRIAASCERQELPLAIAFTKMDRDKKAGAAEWIDLYRELGYAVYPTSVQPGKETVDTLDALREVLRTNTTVLSGLSGVGKSSLINHLIPGLDLRIGSMSRIRQGKHTTTHTQLIPLPGGGHVLDTPGIRNFTLFGVAPNELTFWFRELREIARDCEYRNCTHRGEDGCAVPAAIESGRLHPSRYDSYLRMFDELDKKDWE